MSEKDYVLDTLANLKAVIKFFVGTFCAVVSFLVAECSKDESSSILIYGSLLVLLAILIFSFFLVKAYKKYLKRLRKL